MKRIAVACFGLLVGCGDGNGEQTTTFDPTVGSDETSASDDTGPSHATGSAATSEVDDDTETEADTDCIPVTWYRDADGDGRGDPNDSVVACTAPPGYVGPADDCDDTDPDVHPFADELCDGIDNDCNGLVDEHSPQNPMCNGCTTASMGEHAYWFCPEEASWHGGMQQCAELFGADLVTIGSGVVDAFLVANAPAGPASWWIGLSDIEVEGMFVWPDGSPATYTNWNEGEPNDSGGVEDCVEMSSTTGRWNDIVCDTLRATICGASAP